MNDQPLKGAARPEIQSRPRGDTLGAWTVITLLVVAWVLAYAFAVRGTERAGDIPPDVEYAMQWQRMIAPAEIDIARRR